MSSLDRVRVELSGFVGAPGVMTFYAVSGGDLIGALNTFVGALLSYQPSVVHTQVLNTGDTIDDETGDLTGSWAGDVQTPNAGTGGGDYAAPTGACITWLTPIVRDAHRIKGRTFVVPMSVECFQSDGSIQPGVLSGLEGAAATFVTNAGGNLRIWHRPRLARAATSTQRALTAHAGSQAAVTASSVRDKVAVLRSRRD